MTMMVGRIGLPRFANRKQAPGPEDETSRKSPDNEGPKNLGPKVGRPGDSDTTNPGGTTRRLFKRQDDAGQNRGVMPNPSPCHCGPDG